MKFIVAMRGEAHYSKDVEIEAESAEAAVRIAQASAETVPVDVKPKPDSLEDVDGEVFDVIGLCEGCLGPILEPSAERYQQDSEGYFTCAKCLSGAQ